MLDLIVDRRELKATIAGALRFMGARAEPAPAPVSEPEIEAVTVPDDSIKSEVSSLKSQVTD
jgi:hypothetical protein